MVAYNHQSWKAFRAVIIERDDDCCTVCHRGSHEGAVLQVHHKYYIEGKKPWEYPVSACKTLCRFCHAIEHGKIRPSTGWHYIDREDLGDLVGACEYCETPIRYVFYVWHPKWGTLEVGTICCDNLTETVLASTCMESLKRFQRRRDSFVASPRWYKLDRRTIGIHQKGIAVEIVESEAGFQISMNSRRGKLLFSTLDAAKSHAFEVVENGRVKNFPISAKNIGSSKMLDRQKAPC